MNVSSEKIKLVIAHRCICLDVRDAAIADQTAIRYRDFVQDQACTYSIAINLVKSSNFELKGAQPQIEFSDNQISYHDPFSDGRLNFATQQGDFNTSSPFIYNSLDYFLRILLSYLALKGHGLIVHAAGVLHNDKGYLFLGPSGSGKTTVAKLSANDVVLNDDLLVILPSTTGWEVYSTPFTNQDQVRPQAGRMPLNSMFLLAHGKTNRLEALAPAVALAEFIACVPVLPAYPQFTSIVLNRAFMILGSIPLHKLHFTPDPSFWKLIDAVL